MTILLTKTHVLLLATHNSLAAILAFFDDMGVIYPILVLFAIFGIYLFIRRTLARWQDAKQAETEEYAADRDNQTYLLGEILKELKKLNEKN